MAMKWNCLEPLTAIGIGLGACALAPIDAGLTAGAVIGGAGLLGRIKENSRKAGLDDEALIARMQKVILREEDRWDDTQEKRDAITNADNKMARLLPQVMLTREELAATATDSATDAYPAMAALKVVERLARLDQMFAKGPDGEEPLERQFALKVIERALRAAKEDRDYATFLTLDIAIELGRAQAETQQWLERIEAKVDAGFKRQEQSAADQIARLANIEEMLKGQLTLPEKALKGAIARFVKFKPSATITEIVDAIEEFAEHYEKLKSRVQDLDADDNRVRGLQQEAKFALEAGNLELAREYLQEASALRVDAASQALSDAAETLLGLGDADLLALDWAAAADNWAKAAAILAPFEPKRAALVQRLAGAELAKFGEKHGGDALGRAIDAYGGALEVCTQHEMQLEYAITQNGMGDAFRIQGERLGGAGGRQMLEQALRSFESFLDFQVGREEELEVAGAQHNIAITHLSLARLSGGQTRRRHLFDAIELLEKSVRVTKSKDPLLWAESQNSLGNAYAAADWDMSWHAHASIEAFEKAISIVDRNVDATRWAGINLNLCSALVNWAASDWTYDPFNAKRLEYVKRAESIALDALDALDVLDPSTSPILRSSAYSSLAYTYDVAAQRTSGEERQAYSKKSIVAARSAIETLEGRKVPDLLSAAQATLAEKIMRHAHRITDRSKRRAALVEAKEAFGVAMRDISANNHAMRDIHMHRDVGSIEIEIAKIDKDAAAKAKGVFLLELALEKLTALDPGSDFAELNRLLEAAKSIDLNSVEIRPSDY